MRCFVGGGGGGATGVAAAVTGGAACCWDDGGGGAGGANFGRGDSLSAVRCLTELNMRLSRSSSLLLLELLVLLVCCCCCVGRLRLSDLSIVDQYSFHKCIFTCVVPRQPHSSELQAVIDCACRTRPNYRQCGACSNQHCSTLLEPHA